MTVDLKQTSEIQTRFWSSSELNKFPDKFKTTKKVELKFSNDMETGMNQEGRTV